VARWIKSWNGNALLAWLAVVAFAMATVWPHVAGEPIPLIGLRALADARMGVPLLLCTLALAVFLSRRAWISRDRRLVCGGASLCLFAVVTYAMGAAVALPFAFIGANLLREARLGRTRSAALWAETQ
jgi:hypothetical protein